jgi:hypothetical protein
MGKLSSEMWRCDAWEDFTAVSVEPAASVNRLHNKKYEKSDVI